MLNNRKIVTSSSDTTFMVKVIDTLTGKVVFSRAVSFSNLRAVERAMDKAHSLVY